MFDKFLKWVNKNSAAKLRAAELMEEAILTGKEVLGHTSRASLDIPEENIQEILVLLDEARSGNSCVGMYKLHQRLEELFPGRLAEFTQYDLKVLFGKNSLALLIS